jgi:dephospho-CoA kinase
MGLKPVLGVMGAIGSGKSTVASLFAEHGLAVIDADRIVDKLYSDTDFIKSKLVPVFGEKILREDQTVNRRFIADVVFSEADKLKALNQAVHPAVISRIYELMELYDKDNKVKGVVLDVPLLLETSLDKVCDYLIFIESDLDKSLQRASKRSGIAKKELEKRQKSQIFLDKKKNIANYTIYNNTETSAMEGQVADVISDIFHNFYGE